MNTGGTIAYFSMEIALEPGMPTYSGGLGILAGDTIRSAADQELSLVAVSLLHRKGYFFQRIAPDGTQSEEPVVWAVEDFLTPLTDRVEVSIEGRKVRVAAWKYKVHGVTGHTVPVYLLDTDLPENAPEDRRLTDVLYGEGKRYRLCQEVVLGMGGVKMLDTLGHGNVARYHMNEGHASFLALQLLEESAADGDREGPGLTDIEAVRERCVFTTHTPVPAGHDKFPLDMVREVIGERAEFAMPDVFCCEGELNMTFLALNLSGYVNGVAKRHGEVARDMFARYPIDSITNGVHVATWASEPFARLFDQHIPGWREDSFSLRYALGIPIGEVWSAHQEAKRELVNHINRETNAGFDTDALTLGFARRMTPYKRPDLLFSDLDRLAGIARGGGPLQVLYGGKAHPSDEAGKQAIRRIHEAANALGDEVNVVFLDNYDMGLGRIITAGVDVWLNTPQPPKEASGTSGMKAAVNGVPSLSVLDGWWIEGCIEGVTGWAIGEDGRNGDATDSKDDAKFLFDKLESVVIPTYYQQRDAFTDMMRHTIALNASFFNAQRMLQQYVLKAYFL
ncbi:MAG: alpha-glucan family phosphorylase [Leptospirillia bacterium]